MKRFTTNPFIAMKQSLQFLFLSVAFVLFQSLIVRHDVDDQKFIDYAKNYPQICHLPMGEAALIDSLWVVTAGHVGEDLNRDMQNGYSPTVKCNGVEYKIEKVIVHPQFVPIEHDIALIKLKSPVKNITPLKLYTSADETGKEIALVGMGDIGNGLTGPQKWDKITRAATNRIDSVDAQWIIFKFDSPDSKNVTALEGISGPGDSGGPAIVEQNGVKYLIGVSSHQADYGKKGVYGVTEYYTRVSRYAEWISKTMQAN